MVRRDGIPGSWRWALACASFLVGVAPSPVCHGSTQSVALTRQAAEALDDRRLEDGLKKLDEAIAADPEDAQAVFFKGVALNRLGRHRESLDALEKASHMGSTHPDMPFEKGWALLGLGQWSEAASSLESYEKQQPGRGQTSEFLGRAYLELGDTGKARLEFADAVRRDPSLKPTVDLYLASLEARENHPEASRSALIGAAQSGDQQVADAANARLGPSSDARPREDQPSPWHFGLSLGGGYNSNVYNLQNGITLPAGAGRKDSPSAQVKPSVSYDLLDTPTDKLILADQLEGDFYQGGGPQHADVLDNQFDATFQHQFNPQWAASMRAFDGYTLIAWRSFSDVFGARPALAYRPVEWAVTEASYIYQHAEYQFPSFIPAQRRSGDSHTLTIAEYLLLPHTKIQLRGGYLHQWSAARGADFDFHSDALFVGLSSPIVWGITGDVSYAHMFDRYDHLNSFTGLTARRHDDTDVASATLSKEIARHVTVFVGYQFVNDRSNILFYRYDQHVVRGGMEFSF